MRIFYWIYTTLCYPVCLKLLKWGEFTLIGGRNVPYYKQSHGLSCGIIHQAVKGG